MADNWVTRHMENLLSHPVSSYLAGGFTALWGWISNVDAVGVAGILGVAASIYFQYKRHKREEAAHRYRCGRDSSK